MRSRGTAAAKPRRSTGWCEPKVGRADRDARERAVERRERPAAPQLSSFRRVAVFVPFNASDAPRES
jgi:hypothetical protein